MSKEVKKAFAALDEQLDRMIGWEEQWMRDNINLMPWVPCRIWTFKKCWKCHKLIRPGKARKHESTSYYQHLYCVFLSELIT